MICLPIRRYLRVPFNVPSLPLAGREGKLATSSLSGGIAYKYRTSGEYFLALTSNQEGPNGWEVGIELKEACIRCSVEQGADFAHVHVGKL